MLRTLLLTLTLLAACAGPAHAQISGHAIGGLSGFSGFFGSSTGLHGAVGVEALAAGIAGASAEFGLLGNEGSALWVSSINGVVHVLPNRRGRKVSPYVTAGYTRMSSGDGEFNAWNAGGGLDIWPKERVGIRAEFRDHLRNDSRGDVHYWSLRAGITVR